MQDELHHGEMADVDRVGEIPDVAFLRLAYGRLDEEHTPAGIDPTHLAELRRVFPGF